MTVMGHTGSGTCVGSEYTTPLRLETNVLLPVRLQELRSMANVSLVLALISVGNFALNVSPSGLIPLPYHACFHC